MKVSHSIKKTKNKTTLNVCRLGEGRLREGHHRGGDKDGVQKVGGGGQWERHSSLLSSARGSLSGDARVEKMMFVPS